MRYAVSVIHTRMLPLTLNLYTTFTDLHDVVYTCFFALVGNGVALFGNGLESEIGYYELCHDNLRKGE